MLGLYAIAAGLTLGFLAGIGVGGGTLLFLYLTLIQQLPYDTARIINLLFFIPSAIIASLFRWKQNSLHLRNILPAIIAGCISAAICSLIRNHINVAYLKKVFGILLLFAGLRELFYRPRKAK